MSIFMHRPKLLASSACDLPPPPEPLPVQPLQVLDHHRPLFLDQSVGLHHGHPLPPEEVPYDGERAAFHPLPTGYRDLLTPGLGEVDHSDNGLKQDEEGVGVVRVWRAVVVHDRDVDHIGRKFWWSILQDGDGEPLPALGVPEIAEEEVGEDLSGHRLLTLCGQSTLLRRRT